MIVVGEWFRWYWFGWKEDNAGRGGLHPCSSRSFSDTSLRKGPIRSCTVGRETGQSDQSVEGEVVQEGRIVAIHCAMHPFDEPKGRKEGVSWCCTKTSYAPGNHVSEMKLW